jgi:hypothetical protein
MTSVMTAQRLLDMMAVGLGQGRDDGYRSWIRVRRRTSARLSNLHSMNTPLYDNRSLQLLSGLEFDAAQIVLWLLGKTGEVREQHPAWPGEHVHPLSRPSLLSIQAPRVPGLLAIAHEAGIKHGFYIGTKLPFVATIDFSVTVRNHPDERLVNISCKPRKLLESARNRTRMRERIKLESLYSEAVSAQHIVFDGEGYSDQLIANLAWMRPYRYQMKNAEIQSRICDYSATFMDHADASIDVAKSEAARKTGIQKELSEDVFKMAAWLGEIPLDFSRPVVMSQSLRRDQGIKAALGQKFLGI